MMRRDPKHAEELDNKLQENVVQKNHLLQVLNKEDLEGQFSKLVEGLSDAKSSGDSITVLYGSETGQCRGAGEKPYARPHCTWTEIHCELLG